MRDHVPPRDPALYTKGSVPLAVLVLFLGTYVERTGKIRDMVTRTASMACSLKKRATLSHLVCASHHATRPSIRFSQRFRRPRGCIHSRGIFRKSPLIHSLEKAGPTGTRLVRLTSSLVETRSSPPHPPPTALTPDAMRKPGGVARAGC